LGVLALTVALQSFCLDAIKERPQFIVTVEFNPFAGAQLPRTLVNVVEKLLPPSQQFNRFIQRLGPVVKDTTGDRVLDKLLVMW
jgi:hypothetical protein